MRLLLLYPLSNQTTLRMQHLLLHSMPEEPVVLRPTDRARRWRTVRAHAGHLLERFETGKHKTPGAILSARSVSLGHRQPPKILLKTRPDLRVDEMNSNTRESHRPNATVAGLRCSPVQHSRLRVGTRFFDYDQEKSGTAHPLH